MKSKIILYLTTLASLLLPTLADEKRPPLLGAKVSSDYSLDEPFEAEELQALAANPKRSSAENRRLMFLILRAAIEKDERFQDLLKRPVLREATNVDLALSAYDFSISQNKSALDRILGELATEDVGADTDTIIVMSVIDEWDRTLRAFRKHFVHTDGAGGTCRRGFMATRASLYPAKYERMRAVIEAPINWTAPLLPKANEVRR